MSRVGEKLWFVAGIALAMASSFAQASGPERPPGNNEKQEMRRAASHQDIEKVIQQLGSKKFKEREAANKALLAIGYPALEALRKAAGHDNDAEVRARSAALVRQIENQFDTLAADYRAFGLPLPPRSAKLVCFSYGNTMRVKGKREPRTYGLVFLVEPVSKQEQRTMPADTNPLQPGPFADLTVIEPEAAFSKESENPALADRQYREIERLLRQGRLDFADGGLPFAIQCKARERDRLAQAVFDDYQESHANPRHELARLAWYYWEQKLPEPGSDWKLIAARLERILATDKSLDDPINRAFFRSLEAALAPSKARPGSIAALIDALIDCRSTCLPLGEADADPSSAELQRFWFGAVDEPDPRFLKLVLRGFDAVPELIEHLDDQRLTRLYLKSQIGVPVGFKCRVAHLVSDLLEGLADDDLDRSDYRVDKVRARAWWEKAKLMGEENYLIQHVLDQRDDDRLPELQLRQKRAFDPDSGQWPNSQLLWIIFDKYPQRLPEIYHAVLDKPLKIASRPLAYAIRHGKLPREKKLELLAYGCSHKNLTHRAAALWQLRELDRERFVKNLVDTLDSLPTSPTQACWECPETLFAVIVREIDDQRAWQALLRAAKRAEVGLRMEYLGQVASTDGTPPQRWQRAKFLAEFLDDDTVRDGKGRRYEDGQFAEVGTYEIEVRNFAAIAIGRQLNLPRPVPGEGDVFLPIRWEPEQWSELRSRAREALKGQPPTSDQSLKTRGKQGCKEPLRRSINHADVDFCRDLPRGDYRNDFMLCARTQDA